jgi:hypothetical protein
MGVALHKQMRASRSLIRIVPTSKGRRTILVRLQSRGLFRCLQSFLYLLDLRHQLLFGGGAFYGPGKRLERRENCFQSVPHKFVGVLAWHSAALLPVVCMHSLTLSNQGTASDLVLRGPLCHRFVPQRGGYRQSKRADDCEEPDANPCDKSRGARMNSALAYPVIHWSSSTSLPTTRNARTAITRPKRMDARRARSAGDKTLMAALYIHLRELVGRGGGLVQRPAPSGEQHEAAANATVECLVFEATRKRYAQTEFFSGGLHHSGITGGLLRNQHYGLPARSKTARPS